MVSPSFSQPFGSSGRPPGLSERLRPPSSPSLLIAAAVSCDS
jgi:hypothetical protein